VSSVLINNESYFNVLERVKAKIQNAQYKAVLGANREWGNKFIDNLARDIKLEFPNATGYSVRNLKYMRKFAELFPEIEEVNTDE
jgi:hypothetical protein